MKSSIPNAFTLGNLGCGLLGIMAVMEANPLLAFVLMLVSGILDFFDGMIARWLKVEGELGLQLDSLADLVSFGVLPGLIWNHYMNLNGYCSTTGFCINGYVWMAIPLAGAYRLARFNISKEKSPNFTGVPIPITGITLASWAWINSNYSFGFIDISKISNQFYVWLYMPLVASYLMVSEMPLLSLKFNGKDGLNPFRLGLILLGIASVLVFGPSGVAVFYFLYVGLSYYSINLKKSKHE